MKNNLQKVIVIMGPTASGKTKLAVKLAREFNGEIISADSRQVYKGMDIGSGKDINEYKEIKYHLIDVSSPEQLFNLASYQRLATKAINNVIKNKKLPILCGGTGLYAEAVFDGYVIPKIEPNLKLREKLKKLSLSELQIQAKKLTRNFNESDWQNPVRLIRALEMQNEQIGITKKSCYDAQIFAVKIDKEKLKNNISRRLYTRLKQGMVEEVANLHKNGLSWKKLEAFGLEYKIISHYLQNKITAKQMEDNIINESVKYAKRQITWLKRPALKDRVIWITSYSEIKKHLKTIV